DLGSSGPVGRESQGVTRGSQAGTARPHVPRGLVVPDPDRPAVARFARGIRRLECGVPKVQALAAGRGVCSLVRRPAARAPGAGHLPAVRRLHHHPRPPARGRRPKKDREAEEALGRSRGGYGTKIHLTCLDEDPAVEAKLPPGQAGDAPEFAELFTASTQRVPTVEEVVADKAYDSWAIKDQVIQASMPAHIPSKVTATEPWPIDADAYK